MMIDIKQYLDTIQVASRGEEVRDSIINALREIGALANDKIHQEILDNLTSAIVEGTLAAALCTKDEYDALPEADKLAGIVYFLYDTKTIYYESKEYGNYSDNASIVTLTKDEYSVLPESEKLSGSLYFIHDAGEIMLEGKQYVGAKLDESIVDDAVINNLSELIDNSCASIVSLSKAEYDALSDIEKLNGSVYFVEDEHVIYHLGSPFSPVYEMLSNTVASLVVLTRSDYDELSDSEKLNGSIYLLEDEHTIYHLDAIYGGSPIENELTDESELAVTSKAIKNYIDTKANDYVTVSRFEELESETNTYIQNHDSSNSGVSVQVMNSAAYEALTSSQKNADVIYLINNTGALYYKDRQYGGTSSIDPSEPQGTYEEESGILTLGRIVE